MGSKLMCKFMLIAISWIHLCYCGGMQRYAAKGFLKCGDSPAMNVKVKLVDVDTPGFDDIMDVSYTDENGEFFLAGQAEEITQIDPVLKIYHDCSDGLPWCNRRWKMTLPKYYITKPGEEPNVYDIGVYNLEIKFRKEKRHCIH